jgi:hypothetical protein
MGVSLRIYHILLMARGDLANLLGVAQRSVLTYCYLRSGLGLANPAYLRELTASSSCSVE